MAGGMHGGGACMVGGMHCRRHGHCSGRYASYWNAFLLNAPHFFFQIHDFLFEYVANNSDIAELVQIGSSYEGRPFYSVHVSRDQLPLDGGGG